MIATPSTLARLAVAVCVSVLVSIGSSASVLASTTEETVLDLTDSGPHDITTTDITYDYGWQFAPNESAELSTITLWQAASPNTASITVRENNNDTLGSTIGTFTYEPSPSDNTVVASILGIDFYAFNYRGSATVDGTDQYWLVVTPGSSPTRFIGANSGRLQYEPGTPGRAVLAGNNFYRGSTSAYFAIGGSFIYVLRRAVPGAATSGQVPEVVRTMSFTLPEGMTCAMGDGGANVGLWVRLPAASDCSFAGGSEDANAPQLLGWANAPDFPVSIAQRQIDNGWGAHEMTNDEGAVTSVFIPAGGSAQITGDARFFPVFAG